MESNKKVILISENEELYKSFKRAFKAIVNLKVVGYLIKFGIKQNIVMNITIDNNDINTWLWGEFRSIKKALNPLIVIGTEDKESFIKKNPVFSAYSDEHAYFRIPFDLNNFLGKVRNMKPIYDNVTRKLMVKDFSKGYEYTLITHDLKIIKGDKTPTIENLLQIRDFYQSKGDNKTAKIIDEKVKAINSKDDWEQVALEIKNYLEERLRGKP